MPLSCYRCTASLTDTASKGAVLAMTRELAMVHAREGIRLNSLCPYVPSPTYGPYSAIH